MILNEAPRIMSSARWDDHLSPQLRATLDRLGRLERYPDVRIPWKGRYREAYEELRQRVLVAHQHRAHRGQPTIPQELLGEASLAAHQADEKIRVWRMIGGNIGAFDPPAKRRWIDRILLRPKPRSRRDAWLPIQQQNMQRMEAEVQRAVKKWILACDDLVRELLPAYPERPARLTWTTPYRD